MGPKSTKLMPICDQFSSLFVGMSFVECGVTELPVPARGVRAIHGPYVTRYGSRELRSRCLQEIYISKESTYPRNLHIHRIYISKESTYQWSREMYLVSYVVDASQTSTYSKNLHIQGIYTSIESKYSRNLHTKCHEICISDI